MTVEQQESQTQTTDSAADNVNAAQPDNGMFSEVNETADTTADNQETTTPDTEDGDSLLAKVEETTDDPKVSDSEKVEDEKADDSAEPIEYNLELPENSLLDESALAEVKAFAEANKLTSEAAQHIVERENRAAEGALQGVMDQYNAEAETNRQALLNDPELGGENLKETDKLATAVLKRFDPTGELQALLIEGKHHQNPLVVRFLVGIGKASAPDTLHLGGSRGPAGDSRQEAAEVLFPSNKL